MLTHDAGGVSRLYHLRTRHHDATFCNIGKCSGIRTFLILRGKFLNFDLAPRYPSFKIGETQAKKGLVDMRSSNPTPGSTSFVCSYQR